MATIRHSIQVKVPVYTVYNQLTQFGEYSRFMEDVESVRQLDDTHLHWTTKMANRPVEWDAEITEQEADRCIAWHNTSGPTNAGKVEVQPLDQDSSEVTITLFTEPEQVPGSMAGYTEEEMARRLEQDLVRLKDLVETGSPGTSGGGWRAEVRDSSIAKREQGMAQQQHRHQHESSAIPMRHLGQLPQDTSAEEHGGVPTSDSTGRALPPGGQGTLGAVNQMDQTDSRQAAATGNRAEPGPKAAGASAVVGASGGTDAAAGARLSGSKQGGPGGPSPQQTSDATGAPGMPGGMVEGDAISAAAGAGATGGTGLGSAATADDTRTGTGTSSGSGISLTGGGASGGRDAGISGGTGNAPKP